MPSAVLDGEPRILERVNGALHGTKSGGNAFRGSGLKFSWSDRLDARNYFDDPTKSVRLLHRYTGY